MGGASYIPDRSTKLLDMPASLSGQAGKVPTVNTPGTAYELATPAFLGLSDTFASYVKKAKYKLLVSDGEDAIVAMPDTFGEFISAAEYDAACVITTTTLSATLNAGSMTMSVADASSFAAGQGVAIPGAGVAGAELVTTITGVGVNTISFSDITSTTVASGTTIYHDDTVALNTILANEQFVYSPGSHNVTGTVTMAKVGSGWVGPNFADPQGRKVSGVYQRNPACDSIYMNANDTFLSGFFLKMATGVTATSGAGVLMGPNTGTSISRACLFNFSIMSTYTGFKARRITGCAVYNTQMTLNPLYSFHLATIPPYAGFFSDIRTAASTACFFIEGCDFSRFSRIGAVNSPIAFHVQSNLGYVRQLKVNDFYFDNITTQAIKFEKTTYPIYHCSMSEGTTGAGACAGIDVSNGCIGTSFNEIEIPVSSAGTAAADYGDRTTFNGLRIRLELTSGSKTGIKLGSTSTRAIVTNCQEKASSNGLQVLSGATYATITGNNFTTSASIAANAKATCIIKNNQGIPDYETSIASTPNYIGQEALVSGIWYKAIGTSSTADWKALN